MQSRLRSASKTMRYWQASQSCGGLPGGLAGSGLRSLSRMRRTRGTSSSPKRYISGLAFHRDARRADGLHQVRIAFLDDHAALRRSSRTAAIFSIGSG